MTEMRLWNTNEYFSSLFEKRKETFDKLLIKYSNHKNNWLWIQYYQQDIGYNKKSRKENDGLRGAVWSGLDDLVSEYIGFGGFSYDSYGVYAFMVNISDTDFSCGLTPRRMKVFPLDREKARQ